MNRVVYTLALSAFFLSQSAVASPRRVPPKINSVPNTVNDSRTQALVGPGSRGSAVLRAQILLDRAHFSPGEIDGHFGDDLRVAVTGYQQAQNLKVSGRMTKETWDALNRDRELLIIAHTISGEEVKGPFEPIPEDMAEKSKLKALGYATPQEALGEKFHSSPQLLASLNPGKDLSKPGEEIMVLNVVRRKLESAAARVEVSKASRTVSVLDASGDVLARYPATIGSEHDPLPVGDWKVTAVQHNPVFNYNPALFWDAAASEEKARIAPGPNNPVGTVWVGLSKEHYGIHGTPEPGQIGHSQSHGCIRLTNWDAEELSHLVKTATPVILKD